MIHSWGCRVLDHIWQFLGAILAPVFRCDSQCDVEVLNQDRGHECRQAVTSNATLCPEFTLLESVGVKWKVRAEVTIFMLCCDC